MKFKLFWILYFICLLNIDSGSSTFIKFTNITCESKDKHLCSVEYCFIRSVNRLKNFMSLRYSLLKPVQKNIGFQMRLAVRNNGWKPFLYAIDIDMCRFWKLRYNAIAKMLFAFLDGHTNINHSCPYSKEKFLTIDNVMNTDVNKRLHGIPLGKGQYGLFTKWSWENQTRAETNIFFEVLNV